MPSFQLLEGRNTRMNRILPEGLAAKYPSAFIEVSTLDSEMNELNPPRIDLVKIDVEGYEYQVLLGAMNMIKKLRPILVIKVIDTNLQVHKQSSKEPISLLLGLGYKTIDLKTQKPVSILEKIETDIICYPI